MGKLELKEGSLASSFYASVGETSTVFGQVTRRWVQGAINVGAQAIASALRTAGEIGRRVMDAGREIGQEIREEGVLGALGGSLDRFRDWVGRIQLPGGVSYGDWLRDDPLGAVAGAGAVLLTAGVVVAGGAAVVGGVQGVAGAIARQGVVRTLFGGIAGLFSLKSLLIGGVTGITVALLGQWFRNTAQFIWEFNWQISDRELNAQIDGAIQNMYSLAGGALGTLIGTWGCGSLAGKSVVRFNPAMALRVKEELGEEVYGQLMAQVSGLIFGASALTRQIMFNQGFMNIRRWAKWIASSPTAQGILGEERTQLIRNWGSPQNEPWSFAEAFEKKLESIPDRNWRAFTVSLFDNLFDSCGDAIVAITSV